ncbi:MAG: TetR/AcrR family transcriptional regulator [Xanthomonadales bacterium]|jgi:AcrR family transcriptional regulator|nr:TetR/AcrR family transcriptional regulator [Xanthomonadales bacterium]
MVKNPVWKKAQELQAELKTEAVLSEAAELFNLKGYHATSLNEVAERLGFTKTAIYYYVKNKNDLLYQTYIRSLDEIDQATVDAETKGKDGLDKLCQYVLSEAFVHKEASALLQEIEAISDSRRREEIKIRLSGANRRIAGWIQEGINDGSIAPCDPDLAGRFVMGAFNWMPRWIASHEKSIEEVTEYFVSLIRKTLAPG